MSLASELRRRDVICMAGLYLVGAWLLVLGFVSAVVFSSICDLTLDDLKRDGEVTRAHSIAPQTAQRMDRLILAGVAAVILPKHAHQITL